MTCILFVITDNKFKFKVAKKKGLFYLINLHQTRKQKEDKRELIRNNNKYLHKSNKAIKSLSCSEFPSVA